MMLTNEERRKVAARLRSVTEEERKFCFTEEILAGCIGTRQCLNKYDGTPDEWLILQELADLIEPEPERTCTIERTEQDEFGIYDYLSCGHIAMRQWPEKTQYCPECGTKVVV